ncbi:MAG: ABC transporter substrate-binding protein [Anaerolineae bacterium]
MTDSLPLRDRRENEPRKMSRRAALKYLSSLGVAAAASYLAGCVPTAASPTATPPPTAAATARASNTVVVYSALNETTNNAFIAAFRAANPGMEVALLPIAASGDVQARIIAEKDSPRADVFVGGSSEFHDPLGKAGLLEAYQSPNTASIPPVYRDPNGFWAGWYLGIFGMGLNTERFKVMKNVKKPATWDDLLDPAWKGQIILPDPVRTGGGFIFLATQVFRFNRDEDQAMGYMKKLHPNIAQYVGNSPQGVQFVSLGAYTVGPNWVHDILSAKSQGNPIEAVVPEMTGFEIGAVSIIKGGPNTAGAKTFVDWVLSRQAAELNVKLSNRLSVLAYVPPAPGAPTLDQVKLVDYDRAWATDNKDRLIKKWQAAVG